MSKLVNKNYKNENLVEELSKELLKIFNSNKETVLVCIGTDRCIADSLSPFIGTILKENNFTFPVYGTIKEPMHALNLNKRLNEIKIKHPTATIIGIDACLGDEESIGDIALRDRPVCPGKALGKSLPPVGDFSIIGITNESGNELWNSNNTRLDFILDMAKIISNSLIKAEKEYYILNREIAIC